MQIDLASSLFTAAERAWMRELRDYMGRHGRECSWSVVWPGDLFSDDQIKSWGQAAKLGIFKGCPEVLAASDVVLAVLDGTQVDDSTVWEITPVRDVKRIKP